MKYWVSKEFVATNKKHLFHVWETGLTHSTCVAAFDSEDIAKTYCNFLNQ